MENQLFMISEYFLSKAYIVAVFVVHSLMVPVSYAASDNGWFNNDTKFASLPNQLRQGEAWAICASVYDLMSGNQKEADSRRDYRKLANATRFSVAVSQIVGTLNANMSRNEVDDLWVSSQKISNELTKAQILRILEEVERLSNEGIPIEAIWRKFIRSTEICKLNSEDQLTHVPFFEGLLSSGRLSSKPLILEFIAIEDKP